MAPISLSSSTSSPEVAEVDRNDSTLSTPSKMVSTTTISTIAVQSGSTRIIIAILRAGLHITIKILDMQPGIAYIGNSFGDAAELQMAHNEVIKSLQSKQSPVEDLLRQADGMIANQKPRAEVYSAMADSLGQAWRDLNGQLEQRKTILDQNYMFQGHFQDYREVTNDLEHLCINQKIPEDHGSVEIAIKALTKGKRTMLESSVYALQEGDTLLDMLQKMKDDIIMDSRPKFMRNSFLLTIGQVKKDKFCNSKVKRESLVCQVVKTNNVIKKGRKE